MRLTISLLPALVLCGLNRAGLGVGVVVGVGVAVATEPAERELVVGPELPDGSYIEELSGAKTRVKDGRMKVKVAPRPAAHFAPAVGAKKS